MWNSSSARSHNTFENTNRIRPVAKSTVSQFETSMKQERRAEHRRVATRANADQSLLIESFVWPLLFLSVVNTPNGWKLFGSDQQWPLLIWYWYWSLARVRIATTQSGIILQQTFKHATNNNNGFSFVWRTKRTPGSYMRVTPPWSSALDLGLKERKQYHTHAGVTLHPKIIPRKIEFVAEISSTSKRSLHALGKIIVHAPPKTTDHKRTVLKFPKHYAQCHSFRGICTSDATGICTGSKLVSPDAVLFFSDRGQVSHQSWVHLPLTLDLVENRLELAGGDTVRRSAARRWRQQRLA